MASPVPFALVDSHCHLADEAFRDDLDEVVHRARAAGLQHVLCILDAGDADETTQANRLAALWPGARFACGVHPHQAVRFAGRIGEVEDIVRAAIEGRHGTLAVGEIGLDYHYDFSPREVQREVFAAQVRLAGELRKPVVIHTREADADTIDILRTEGRGDIGGVFHCFTGDASLAEAALKLGFALSFAGIITFPKSTALRDVAKTVPADRLLVETDAPFLAPVPHRGGRNEPAWVVRTAETLAVVRGTSTDRIAAVTTANFLRLFGD